MRRIIAALTALSFFLYSTAAFADDPVTLPTPQPPPELSLNLDLRVTELEEGAVAPFAGVLLTTDAMTKVQYDHTLRLSLLENSHSFALRKLQLQFDAESTLRLSEREMHQEIFNSQLKRIEGLEEIAMKKRPDWVLPVAILTSFVVAAGVTVGITYAVNQP